MRVDDFDFDLPDDRIALRPTAPRDAARLLLVADHGLADLAVRDLPALLDPGDLLVFNDTRVIAARLKGWRARAGGGAAVEATLVKRLGPDRWSAFARPGRRLRPGDQIAFAGGALVAQVAARGEGGAVILAFEIAGVELDQAIAAHGAMPLPPYIASRRPEDARDLDDYQTVFARAPASVAAPTAGLHFTVELMDRLKRRGVGAAFATLEVGPGTFLPVKSETLDGHKMHAERGVIDAATAGAIDAARHAGGRIVCVGTTSLRLVESAARADGKIVPFEGETDIFITPGYRFRVADGLITNFHLPRSTLFMLVSALAGLERMRGAYAHAIAAGYRFYSYGDACLIWRRA